MSQCHRWPKARLVAPPNDRKVIADMTTFQNHKPRCNFWKGYLAIKNVLTFERTNISLTQSRLTFPSYKNQPTELFSSNGNTGLVSIHWHKTCTPILTFKPLTPGVQKRPCILKQTYGWKLLFYLNKYDLLVYIRR